MTDFRAALEQALDRMETAWNLLGPDETADDRERIAQALWFGQEEVRAALTTTEAPARDEPGIDAGKARARLAKRHVEKKSWPSVRNDSRAADDGYIHYCDWDTGEGVAVRRRGRARVRQVNARDTDFLDVTPWHDEPVPSSHHTRYLVLLALAVLGYLLVRNVK